MMDMLRGEWTIGIGPLAVMLLSIGQDQNHVFYINNTAPSIKANLGVARLGYLTALVLASSRLAWDDTHVG